MSSKNDGTAGDELTDRIKRMFQEAIPFMTGATEPAKAPSGNASTQDPMAPLRKFNLKPKDISAYLDQYVIGQPEAKRALAVAVCDHYNQARVMLAAPTPEEDLEYAKHNVILLGPTGVGKTYLMRCIARLIGVPFVKADATKFSETGYVGRDVEDMVRDLVKAADGNLELAEHGIIYLDEIDKIAGSDTTAGKDVSGRGVQINLLKLMEDTEVSLFSQTDLLGQMQAIMEMQRGRSPGRRSIRTRHILFIVSGAFDRLPQIVRRRLHSSGIGFSESPAATLPEGELLRKASTRDLISYGFEPEFVGRLPVRVACDALGVEDLESVLKHSKGSILAQYRRDFLGYGIAVEFTEAAIRRAALRAHEEGTGARGLMTVFERTLRQFKFELPSTATKSLTIDADDIDRPESGLERLKAKARDEARSAFDKAFDAYFENFEREYGYRLSLSVAARRRCFDLWKSQELEFTAFFQSHFGPIQHGFRLISEKTGQTTFRLSTRFVEDAKAVLSDLVTKSCR